MDLNKVSVGMVGAVVLLSSAAFNAASAQGTGDSSNVVLPGDVPIKGASSRGWHPSNAAPNPVPIAVPVVTGTAMAPAGTNDALVARGNQLNSRLQAIDTPSVPTFGPGILPGVTYNTPSAYGGYKGMGAIGISYQKLRGSNTRDGVAGLALSFGSPQTVGVDVALNALNLTNRAGQGGFGHRLSLSFKVHKPLSNDWAVAFGGDDVATHNTTFDAKHSYYGVVTKGLRLKPDATAAFSRLDLSLGVGNGRFQSEIDQFAGKNSAKVFGSVALQASQKVRPFAEWTGQDANVGISLVPFGRLPIVITPAFADVAHRNGHTTRFTIGAAYQFRY